MIPDDVADFIERNGSNFVIDGKNFIVFPFILSADSVNRNVVGNKIYKIIDPFKLENPDILATLFNLPKFKLDERAKLMDECSIILNVDAPLEIISKNDFKGPKRKKFSFLPGWTEHHEDGQLTFWRLGKLPKELVQEIHAMRVTVDNPENHLTQNPLTEKEATKEKPSDR